MKLDLNIVSPLNPIRLRDDNDLADLGRRIMIAIPYQRHTGIHAELNDLAMQWQMAGMCVFPFEDNNGGFVELIREHILREFERTGFDFLVMVDSDTIPPVFAPLQLASNNEAVVTGIVPIFHPSFGECANFCLPEPTSLLMPSKKALEPYNKGLLKVSWAGTGVMCISRRIFTQAPEASFLIDNAIRAEMAKMGDIHTTEDKYFCNQITKAGLDIYADLSVKCAHNRNYLLNWKVTKE